MRSESNAVTASPQWMINETQDRTGRSMSPVEIPASVEDKGPYVAERYIGFYQSRTASVGSDGATAVDGFRSRALCSCGPCERAYPTRRACCASCPVIV
jgi:hypothetical protein